MEPEKRSGILEKFEALGNKIAVTFGYAPFRDTVLKRLVPKAAWYQGDGATLALLLAIQVVTGITMILYYTNAADHAYDSVRHITHQITLGWLVRGIHFWTAGIMVVMLFIHVFRHLLLGGYKVPRQGTWTIGVFQFFLVLTMSFTGYVLRWDERAVYAVRVVLNMFHNVPLIGDELVLLVQGGPQLGSLTLTRFFSVHVWVVPLLLLGLVGIHIYLVILHGITAKAEHDQAVTTAEEHKEVYTKASLSEEHGEQFHPHTTFMTGAVALTIFSIAFILALTIGPREMYPEGNLVSQSIPREEWWFWWYSALIAQLPPLIAPVFYWIFPVSLFIGMLLLPLLDRGPNRGARKRPFWTVFVVSCVIGMLWLTDLRTRSPWTGWPDPIPPPAPASVVLSEKSEQGRQLFARYGCNSCHSVSSRGRKVGPDLARIKHLLSRSELHSFILAPPEGVAMPKYRGRITEADLDRIVEFVLVAQTFPRE